MIVNNYPKNNMDFLNNESPTIEQPPLINIQLKNHQLASIYKAHKIEEFNLVPFGIMNDKPGAGKTYTILGLIFNSKWRWGPVDRPVFPTFPRKSPISTTDPILMFSGKELFCKCA